MRLFGNLIFFCYISCIISKKSMKKNKYTADQLVECCITSTDIICTKCRVVQTDYGDEYTSSENFFDKGWRATECNTYCPTCAKRFLKQI